MFKTTLYGLVGALAFFAGCTYEPAYDLTCTDEGALSGDRLCQDGVWIPANAADMAVADTSGGGGDTDDCVPETDAQMCERIGLTCADFTGTDNCGDERTINCGTCTIPGQTCAGGGTENVCACSDQSDAEFCDTNGKECDPFTEIDACGDMRTVNCGTCAGVASCAADNTCTCDVAFACAERGATCGMLDVTGECAGTDSITCGTCDAPNSACVMNQCACADGYEGDGTTCDDIDECADGTDNCDANATCTNTPGSFDCTCNPGYSGDGVNCVNAVDLVSAVEAVEISMNNSSASGTLANAVSVANSVPFMTMRLDNTDSQGNRVAVDVSLTANDEVTIERDNNNGEVTAQVYVVEFDPAFATVQSGTFSFASDTHSESLGTTVDPDESFVVFYFQRDNGSAARDDLFVNATFSAAGDAIEFARESDAGTIDGHYWVVSAVNSSFGVQHISGSLGSVADNFSVPQTVDTSKAFIMYSWSSDHSGDEPDRTQINCNLVSGDFVSCRRKSVAASIPQIWIQVVSLNGTVLVQRGVRGFPGNAGGFALNLPTAVGADAMAFGGALGVAGVSAHESSTGSDAPAGFFTHEITSNGTELTMRRGQPQATQADVGWQVIDW